MSTTRILKWGNSLAFRLPSSDAKEWGVTEGTAIHVEINNGVLTARQASPKYTLGELLAQCTPENMAVSEGDKAWLNKKPAGNEWDAQGSYAQIVTTSSTSI
jgi:antitoxin component of MazEF toxin-antitoxin module